MRFLRTVEVQWMVASVPDDFWQRLFMALSRAACGWPIDSRGAAAQKEASAVRLELPVHSESLGLD